MVHFLDRATPSMVIKVIITRSRGSKQLHKSVWKLIVALVIIIIELFSRHPIVLVTRILTTPLPALEVP